MSVSTRRFGVSTHLFHGERLDRDHLVEIAAHGFETVEVFATQTHFNYHDPAAAVALAEWLDDTRLTLHSMHAPIFTGFVDGAWSGPYSNAVADEARRRRAIDEAAAALAVARTVPYRYLVVHLGVPAAGGAPDDNRPAAAIQSLTEIYGLAEAVGVDLAIEVIPNPLSSAAALVDLIEQEADLPRLGICLDVGHAHLMGDVGEAIETCSGYLATTHLHDNRGTSDDHLVPYAGTIDWAAALMSMQKIGYEGAWIFEVAHREPPQAVLAETRKARQRFEALLDIDAQMIDEE